MSVRVFDWLNDNKYLGSSKAIVIDNKDPEQKGRIRVSSPVYGETGFINYLTIDDGFFSPPDIGSVVYIEAAGGDIEYLIATRVVNDGTVESPDTPEPFRRSVPTNRGWVSPGALNSSGKPLNANGGQIFELDDGEAALNTDGSLVQTSSKKGIRLTTSQGHKIELLEEGSDGSSSNRINVQTKGGQILRLSDDDDSSQQNVLISDTNERTIEISKQNDTIKLRDKDSNNYIELKFSDSTIEIESSTIKLGSNAVEPIILGTSWVAYNNAQIITKLNALITAFGTMASSFSSHTHSGTDSGGDTFTTSPPSPSSTGTPPSAAAVATPALLSIKGRIE
jgi:hypothetical protein